MQKLKVIRDYIVRHYKIFFPVVVVAAVAITVTTALSAGKAKPQVLEPEDIATQAESEPEVVQTIPETPMAANEDEALNSLIASYYDSLASGNTDVLLQICDEMSEKELIEVQAKAQYIEGYPTLDIYTKPGPEAGSSLVYVYYKVMFKDVTAEFPGYQAFYICTDENGKQYIKRGEISEDVLEYIKTVNAHVDVVDFNNRITDEYNQLILDNPELLNYLTELDKEVGNQIGMLLSEQQSGASEETPAETDNQDTAGGETDADGDSTEAPAQEAPVEAGPQYGKATTTVNVRSSDSEKADKVGKLAGGTKVQILEQGVNGWSKILFEGKEGFIKSEYLQVVEDASNAESTGTVTATTNINVRSEANENAEKLGVLAGGDSVELIANENGWCKIKYNGQIGYVKSDYVQ